MDLILLSIQHSNKSQMQKYLLVLLVVFLCSCEEQMIPIPNPPQPTGRVILIEDLTGVMCAPCHAAALLVDANIKQSNGAVVAYGVHGELQSDPHSESNYDFRYQDAFDLESSFNFFGKPAAAINRISFEGGQTAKGNSNTWQPFIDSELSRPQVAELFVTPTYDATTRQVQINVGVTALEDILGEINIHLVISESHLIDPQSIPGGSAIPDFDHKHVMKEALTSVPGGDFLIEGLAKDQNVSKPFSYTLPDEVNGEWVAENMEITAFITAVERGGEVQQAAQVYMTE